jgi:polysaccharide export outer membrane protein
MRRLIVVLAIIVARPAAAQSDRAAIGAGDVLNVTVAGQATLTGKYQVPPDGVVNLPLVGRIAAAGLTAGQFEADLRRGLVTFLRNPDVRVEVERRKRVFVFGDVKTAAPSYDLTENMTVLEVLARAGYTGTSEVLVVRPKSSRGPAPVDDPSADVIRVNLRDLEKEVESGQLARNVVLRDGDTIYVPRQDTNRIFVSGQVRNPGAYSIPDGTTVLQAVTLAGGATERAAVGGARIVRLVDGEQKTVKAKLVDNVKPGDTVVVPESYSFPLDIWGTNPARRPSQQIHFGSALSITPAAGFKRIGVDSNVFNENGDVRSDFTVVGGPQLETVLDLRRVRVTATADVDFVYFRHYENERSINRSGSARTEAFLSRRSAVWVGGRLSNSRDRLDSEVDARARRRERTVDAGIRVRPWGRLGLDLTGRDFDRRFDRGSTFLGIDLSETLTERVQGVSATANLALTHLTSLVFSGSATTHRFPLLPQKNADATEFSIGGVFKPASLVTGEARVGYLRYVGLDPGALDLRGPVGSAAVFYNPKARTRFGIRLERTTGDSFQPQFTYAIVDRAGGSVQQGIFRRFDVLFETYRETFEHQPFAAAGSVRRPDATTDTTQRYMSELGVLVAGATRVSFSAMYVQRLSTTLAARDYNAVRMWASVTYGAFQARGQ